MECTTGPVKRINLPLKLVPDGGFLSKEDYRLSRCFCKVLPLILGYASNRLPLLDSNDAQGSDVTIPAAPEDICSYPIESQINSKALVYNPEDFSGVAVNGLPNSIGLGDTGISWTRFHS